MQCCFTNHFTKLVLFREYLNLKCYSLDTIRNRCHFLNSPVDRLVQFTQVQHNFDSIAVVLKSIGETQAVNKTSKKTMFFSLDGLWMCTSFLYSAWFWKYGCLVEKVAVCSIHFFFCDGLDYLQHWSCPNNPTVCCESWLEWGGG